MLSVVAIGILNVVLSMNILQLALYVPGSKASVSAVIFSSNPIFVTIFSAIADKEKIKLYKAVGLLIGIAGIFTVFFDKLEFNLSVYKSVLLVLSAAIFFGVYTVLGRNVSNRIGSLKMNSYSFIIGSLIMLPLLIVYRIPLFTFDYTVMLR
jgi:drug/metabolite transporter (DMT)-like permease